MTNNTVESKKQALVDLCNAELKRIGEIGHFEIALNNYGVVSAADESGYYHAINYRTLLHDLQEFESGTITDTYYDGKDAHVWRQLWNLFQA